VDSCLFAKADPSCRCESAAGQCSGEAGNELQDIITGGERCLFQASWPKREMVKSPARRRGKRLDSQVPCLVTLRVQGRGSRQFRVPSYWAFTCIEGEGSHKWNLAVIASTLEM